MDDFISRQVALNALQEYWDTIKDKHITLDGEMAVYADCKRIIKMLPSAFPCPEGFDPAHPTEQDKKDILEAMEWEEDEQ